MFNWFHFLTYALVSAITPGPNVMMSMSNASRVGFRKAVRFNFGIWCGFSVVALLCTLFCSLLSSVIPKIKLPMLIIAIVFLLVGEVIRVLSAKGRTREYRGMEADGEPAPREGLEGVGAGEEPVAAASDATE